MNTLENIIYLLALSFTALFVGKFLTDSAALWLRCVKKYDDGCTFVRCVVPYAGQPRWKIKLFVHLAVDYRFYKDVLNAMEWYES